MSDAAYVDENYHQVVPAGSLAERVFIAARDRIYRDFVDLARPQARDTILDAGISDVVGGAANLLERLYPHPEQITAVGLGEAQHEPLPLEAGSFDVACSNAVIEHLGSQAHQVAFVADMARVAKRVFLTVPNHFFPDRALHGAAAGGLDRAELRLGLPHGGQSGVEASNLILMSRRRLAALAGRRVRIGYTGFKLGPLGSNLYLYIE